MVIPINANAIETNPARARIQRRVGGIGKGMRMVLLWISCRLHNGVHFRLHKVTEAERLLT